MYKQLIVGLIIIMSPLYCMEKNEPVASGTMKVLTQDIARKQIQRWLTFQEISHLKRLSKYYNTLYDIVSHCPCSHQDNCSTYACNQCTKNYYQCIKMQVYFALKHRELRRTKGIDEKYALKCERMFQHLCLHHIGLHHRDIRQRNVVAYIEKHKKKPESVLEGESGYSLTIKDAMHYYRYSFKRPADVRSHIFHYARIALEGGSILLANTVLSGSGLNLSNLSKKICVGDEDIRYIFFDACSLKSTDLIKNICGGCLDESSFEYLMRYVDGQLLLNLLIEDILPVKSATKKEKSVLHYAAERGLKDIVIIALEKGVYVNCRDADGMTPLHYAVTNAHLGVVTELLKRPDIGVCIKDKKGRVAMDYNIPARKHPLHIPKRTNRRKEIARMLKDHKDQHQVSGYSHSKVHSNGYQRLL